jgi:hypothetical protein
MSSIEKKQIAELSPINHLSGGNGAFDWLSRSFEYRTSGKCNSLHLIVVIISLFIPVLCGILLSHCCQHSLSSSSDICTETFVVIFLFI